MARNLSEEHEALYQLICSLKSEDIHKVISYVSFLRFVDVYKDKAMADLLRIEITKGHQPEDDMYESFQETAYEHEPQAEAISHEDEKIQGSVPEYVPASSEPESEHGSAYKVEPEYKPEPEYNYEPRYEPEAETRAEVKAEYEATVQAEAEITAESEPFSEPFAEKSAYSAELLLLQEKQEATLQSLRKVVKVLRLNNADVAFLFSTTLPMARMKYLGNESFSSEEELQLKYFLDVTERLEVLKVLRLSQAIRHPMPDGEFFLEKLKDINITDENLVILQKTAENLEELRRKFKGATKPFHDMQDAIGLYATPLHSEG